MENLQEKLETTLQQMEKNKDVLHKTNITRLEYMKCLEEVLRPVYTAHIALRQKIYNTIGHACVLIKNELQEYMDYDRGSYCKDDWNIAQKLMVNGCDPLPRRRCLTRASKAYQMPYPINESLWKLPDDRNVRWGNYLCRNFGCLLSKNPKRGYTKCIGCFEMEKEKLKWVVNSSLPVDFLIRDVPAIKPGQTMVLALGLLPQG
ncbi:hypothetical protein CRYUN_Cryun08bG0012100 [Craigia yunnanensis]